LTPHGGAFRPWTQGKKKTKERKRRKNAALQSGVTPPRSKVASGRNPPI
jgi:hypothetical protein